MWALSFFEEAAIMLVIILLVCNKEEVVKFLSWEMFKAHFLGEMLAKLSNFPSKFKTPNWKFYKPT